MKNLFKISVILISGLLLNACGSNENNNSDQSEIKEINQSAVEEVRQLTNSKGESIQVTYFAKDGEIAVKLKINDEERELIPRGSAENGNPVFSDGEYGWEMFVDGRSGRLFQKGTEGAFYKE